MVDRLRRWVLQKLGRFDPWEEHLKAIPSWEDDTGQLLMWVHGPEKCAGRGCSIHHPSNHHMKNWPRHYRFDRALMERLCEHGVGHPDPDDVAYHKSQGFNAVGVHGCDGCCAPLRLVPITNRDPGDENPGS